MKAVMISIRPEWVEKILSGKKTVEIRKTAPKLKPPFKCYIYCTYGGEVLSYEQYCGYDMTDFREDFEANGKVVAEFICDKIIPIRVFNNGTIQDWNWNKLKDSCLSYNEIVMYIGNNQNGNGWHISELKIYDRPKELHEFNQCHKCEYHEECVQHEYSCAGHYKLQRPPQSWCYVEELR